MQLDSQDHFERIVEAAIADFEHADQLLAAGREGAEGEKDEDSALRMGGAAAIYLHHFADIIASRPVPGLPEFKGQVGPVRTWLEEHSIKLTGSSDVALLGDVADALKHAVLTIRLPREVEEAGQILAVDRPYGTGLYSEGNYGGNKQVWVLARSGRRPLLTVLCSVRDLWKSVLPTTMS